MELAVRIELTTPALQERCTTVVLRQHMAGSVGFEPTSYGFGDRRVTITPETYMAPQASFELATSRLTAARSTIELLGHFYGTSGGT